MPSAKLWVLGIGTVMGLFVAAYLGGSMLMSDTTSAAASDGPRAEKKAPGSSEAGPGSSGAEKPKSAATIKTATFGNGCFWCTEAVFQRLKGVQSVTSGYSGGTVKNPTYRQVCTGTTGHAEAIQITYDPAEVSYQDLLAVFWQTHDPTTLNRQGNDVGPQYRSVIFWHSDDQKKVAEEYKKKLDASGLFSAPIVTEIVPFTEFFPAEAYHQNYFNENSGQPYCRMMIRPKLDKLKKVFHDKLKTNEPK